MGTRRPVEGELPRRFVVERRWLDGGDDVRTHGDRRPVEGELPRRLVVERRWLDGGDDMRTHGDRRPAFEHLAVAAVLVLGGFGALAALAWSLGPVGGVVGAATPLTLVGIWRARRP